MDAFPVSSNLLGKSASAYGHLRRAIAFGQLRPSRRLSATGLAAHYRISETPVREALVRLSAEGFLTWEASKGYFTKPVTLHEQDDLHEVIAISLQACLRSLARSAPDILDVVEQRAAPALLEPADSPDISRQLSELIAEVGRAIVKRNGNAVLDALMSILMDRTQLVRRLALDTPEQIETARLRVSGLASAVLALDGTTAAAIVGQHLAERRRGLPALIEAASAVTGQATYP
ncbi:GntR family transcriptional regulator [Phenylobacterium sp.]|uniref:GntR family transcriptional regulator n=1 Tax=Phenylobacterium sp. TaxID=1871053 RepID=UPI0027319306|nr:GntR family transcriptional regulator [Phenylobacterium sp.]MDP1601116.1 GntR family transcriptional regulator [Phenylobacterium sp.]MDP3593823.1 GntR family transcriptional regulator [Phenylobacterium sp.]